MWRSNFGGWLVLALLLAGAIAGAESAPKSELRFYYFELDPNLGTTYPGVRYGRKHIEVTLENRFGIGANFALFQNFNEKGWIIPRVSLGTQVYGPTGLLSGYLTLIPGMGITFPLFKLFGGKVGIGWDYYVYCTKYNNSFILSPFIPLTLAYYF